MDDLVAERQAFWPRRGEFIERGFERHRQSGVDPTTACFIDGAVLNNRPFQQAISAIHGRPAYRQVDRRLVYVEPHPAPTAQPARRRTPGFFATLRSAMSDIPSSQPVTDELGWVLDFNDRVRRLRSIIDSARPQVSQLVSKVVDARFDRLISADEIRAGRERVNAQAVRDAGFAYQAYVRLKLASVRSFVARLIVKLRGVPEQSPLSRVVAEIIDAWAVRKGVVYDRAGGEALEFDVAAGPTAGWVQYLLGFDVKYRERRLHFMVEGQNRLYQLLDRDRFPGLKPAAVDRLKREFYVRLDALRRRDDVDYYSIDARDLVADIFPQVPSASEMKHLHSYAAAFAETHFNKLDHLMAQIGDEIDLATSTREIDDLLASLDPAEWHPDARCEVLTNYLGFPFWDVLTFPMTSARDMGELNEILIDRISPQDTRALRGFEGVESLRGIGFGHFAAFFSRSYRENDYLLGRLHAMDRLIDIVCDAAGIDSEQGDVDVAALKRRGFAQIIDAEEKHLTQSTELIAALRKCVGEIGRSRSPAS
jgi:patatin-related protein